MLRFQKGQSAIFVGEEQENDTSPKTLFVVHEPPIEEVIWYAQDTNAEVIYFGAGFLSKPSLAYLVEAIEKIQEKLSTTKIVLETNDATYVHTAVKEWGIDVVVTLMMEGALLGYGLLMKQLKDLQAKGHADRIRVKFDMMEHTFSAPLNQMALSSYDQYGDDQLLFKMEAPKQANPGTGRIMPGVGIRPDAY